jgi:hypothetical protein
VSKQPELKFCAVAVEKAPAVLAPLVPVVSGS